MADQEATGTGTGPAEGSKQPNIGGNAAGAPIGAPSASIPAITPIVPPTPIPAPAPTPAAPLPTPIPPQPAATSIAPAQTGQIGDDIAKILQGVKLPERRDTAIPQKGIENKAAVFDTTLGAQAAATLESPKPAAETPVAPQAEQKTPDSVQSVHTLKDDLQNVVHDQKMSIVRAASLEQDRRAHRPDEQFDRPAPHHSKRAFGILFGTFVLVALGAAAIFGVYTVMQQRAAPQQAIQTSSILFSEASVSFPLDNESPNDLKQKLAASISGLQGALGSITAVVPVASTQNADGTTSAAPATFAQFMQAIGAHPPDDLLRALDTKFFFGVHIVDTQAPLFVIPVTSYDHAFAGMLAWEATMNNDLSPVFPAVPATTIDQNGLPVSRTFNDDVIHNYDVRELKDDAGNVKLYYSFPSQNILVIAESPYSFAEILSRLQAARQL